MTYSHHYQETALIQASATDTFNFIDDHNNFSSHMNRSSWMMGGGKMETHVDEGNGQRVGSHIRMSGKVLGINLFLEEVITEYNPPHRKAWETVGNLKLLVIGNYQMGVEIATERKKSKLKVFINYDSPTGVSKLLGVIFGDMYAKWCVHQMLNGVVEHFKST
ncbi:SRPBCC family protein [Candidatus Daviesbacteria bacterium]|nr:SRPBCC family protein [Candidatus Daviesbacteria bacterium]